MYSHTRWNTHTWHHVRMAKVGKWSPNFLFTPMSIGLKGLIKGELKFYEGISSTNSIFMWSIPSKSSEKISKYTRLVSYVVDNNLLLVMVDLPPWEKVLVVYMKKEEVCYPQWNIMFYPRKQVSYGKIDSNTIEKTPIKSHLSIGKPLYKGSL